MCHNGDTPLEHFTTRITRQQKDYLSQITNRSQWVRAAIDKAMRQEREEGKEVAPPDPRQVVAARQ